MHFLKNTQKVKEKTFIEGEFEDMDDKKMVKNINNFTIYKDLSLETKDLKHTYMFKI